MSIFEICQVPNYQVNYENSKKIKKPINVLCTVLEQDHQLHERLEKDDLLKLSVDIDKMTEHNSNVTFDKIINDICEYLNIQKTDISYTQNFSVKSGSHHVVIPKFFMKSCNQKTFWTVFKEKYKYGSEIDANIFNKSGWFRLPNQTKEGLKGTEHIIQEGNMKDFVLKHVCNATLYPFDEIIESKSKATKKTDDKTDVKTNVKTDVKTDNKKNTLLKDLLDCLNHKRADDYDQWVKIGMILKNEHADISLYHYFSKFSSKYDENETNKKYDTFTCDKGLTIATLHSYAKNDNLKLYANKVYNVNLYSPLFTSGLIAEYFKTLYNNKFVYCDGVLYYFNGVYWKRDDKNNSFLNLFVKNEFYSYLLGYAINHIKLNNEDKDIIDDIKENINNKLIELQFNISTLKNIGKRKSFIEDIIIHITNNDIKFDENPYLFAFENKVYNVEIGEFVEPDPKEYLSITAGYKYEPLNDFENKKVFLMNEINKILPKHDIRDFYLTILATGLCGIQLQNLFISTGEGGNGKSVIDTLCLKTTGNYGYKIPNTILMNPIKEGPNPQVYCINNKRFCLATEPSDKHKICCSTIKELTGDKTINVRDNYSSKCGINLKLSLLMECNNLPLLDETTVAMWRRVVAVPFTSRFIDADRYEEEKQFENTFVRDPYFTTDEFHNEYKQVFFMILADYFKVFKMNKYTLTSMPEDCKKLTMDYLAVSDNIFDWFNDSFEKADDEILPFKDVFEIFKQGTFYENLSKADKRMYNQKYFYDKLEKNIFLKKFIKRRDEYVNKKKLSTDSIVGWKEKTNLL